MKEEWTRWLPIEKMGGKYYVDEIKDNMIEFKVIFCNSVEEDKKVSIIFDKWVLAYRSTYESIRQKTINSLYEKYGIDFFSECTFFKVRNSEYIEWVSEQSYGVFDSEELIHFSFVAADSIVDIVASYEPIIEFSA